MDPLSTGMQKPSIPLSKMIASGELMASELMAEIYVRLLTDQLGKELDVVDNSFPRDIKASDIKIGDKIEATHIESGDIFIGVVTNTYNAIGSNELRIATGSIVMCHGYDTYTPVYSFRLLSRKRVYRIGDIAVGSRGDLADLPIGSIIESQEGHRWVYVKRYGNRMFVSITHAERQHGNLSGTYAIVYVAD